MDEVSICIDNLTQEPVLSLQHGSFPELHNIRSDSPLTMSDNNGSGSGSDSEDNEALRIIKRDRVRNEVNILERKTSRFDISFNEEDENNISFSLLDERKSQKDFYDTEKSLSKYYHFDTNYSDKLDILITFMKGQKNLFMQSNFITLEKTYCFMIPILLLSTTMAIFAPIIQEYAWSGGFISGMNVIVTFCVSFMNYMKYESTAEKFLQLANHFDKLEISLEMTSNKLVYMEDDNEKSSLVLGKLNDIETHIKELKELYNVLVPKEITYQFPIICNVNVFSLIKKMENYRKGLIHRLKDIKLEVRYILHKWKRREHLEQNNIMREKERLRILFLYDIKEKIKEELSEHIHIYEHIDEMFSREIKSANAKGVSLFPMKRRTIKKEDVHPSLQKYCVFIFEV
jgi:hypothetical protein